MHVPDWVRKNIFFVGIKQNGKFLPRATGFFVGIEEQQFVFPYIVTAEHVVSGLLTRGHDIYCRFNKTDGQVEELKIPPDYWRFHPDEANKTDVAICGYIPPNEIEYNYQPLNGPRVAIATREIIKERSLGLGEEIFIVGLFRSHHGAQRNVPIVRIGNIAAMADEPVWTEYCGYTDAYLIEARSIGGLSGSPVVVSQPAVRLVDSNARWATGRQFYLLGLIHGHFDVKNLNEDAVSEDVGGAIQNINTGIGVVIPVEKILETINQEEVQQSRTKMVAELRKKGASPDGLKPGERMTIVARSHTFVRPDLALEVEEPGNAEDANPQHQADFKSLLSAAARKQQQDG